MKIGLLLNSQTVPAWQYLMIQEIQKIPECEVSLIILNKSNKLKESLFSKVTSKFNKLFYNIHYKIDRKMFKPNPDAFLMKNIGELLSDDHKTIEVHPIEKKYSDYFDDDDIKKIKNESPDILIRLGFRILRGEILNTANHGVWSFHHGDNLVNRGGPPGYWETMTFEENPEFYRTGSVLQILSEKLDDGEIIDRSWSSTHQYSVSLNINNFYWRSAFMLPRAIQKLIRLGEDEFKASLQAQKKSFEKYESPLYKTPGNWTSLKHSIKQLNRIIKRIIFRISHKHHWKVLFSIQDKLNLEPRNFKNLSNDLNSFVADPHVIEKDGKYYIFVEELPYSTGKGHITVFEVDKNGSVLNKEVVLDLPYHLSYPFVFSHENQFFMIPETSANSSIELYECEEFPFKWKLKVKLMDDINTADTTLLFRDNYWWMFTSPLSHPGASRNDELHVFYSKDLFSSEWIPHVENPISSNVSNARPAGAVFQHNNKLILPTQDNSRTYGYAVNFNEIITLSPEKIVLKELEKLEPKWNDNVVATHTFGRVGKLTFIDCCETYSKIRLP